ncbi:hypothetical protein [Micromonospora cremea]|uniref:hypothetical protein n=1 Tax=Micromonospora cremea TaxID=709881 RepID=UPI0013563ECD|nr:hypothetical protein [Micromonospora cremea]
MADLLVQHGRAPFAGWVLPETPQVPGCADVDDHAAIEGPSEGRASEERWAILVNG